MIFANRPIPPVMANSRRHWPALFDFDDAGSNAIVYEAQGAGPHPTVVLLHGFPGNEKNLVLAQALRRAGWNVVFFHYRGSWGSGGPLLLGSADRPCAAGDELDRDGLLGLTPGRHRLSGPLMSWMRSARGPVARARRPASPVAPAGNHPPGAHSGPESRYRARRKAVPDR